MVQAFVSSRNSLPYNRYGIIDRLMQWLQHCIERGCTSAVTDARQRDHIVTSRQCCVSCTGYLCGSARRLQGHRAGFPVFHKPISGLPCRLPPGVTLMVASCVLPTLRRARFHRSRTPCTGPVGRLGDRSFSVAGPRPWNALPPTLRQQTDASFHRFKRLLKTHSLV